MFLKCSTFNFKLNIKGFVYLSSYFNKREGMNMTTFYKDDPKGSFKARCWAYLRRSKTRAIQRKHILFNATAGSGFL